MERNNLEHSLVDDVREEAMHCSAANHEAQLLKEHLEELASTNEKLKQRLGQLASTAAFPTPPGGRLSPVPVASPRSK